MTHPQVRPTTDRAAEVRLTSSRFRVQLPLYPTTAYVGGNLINSAIALYGMDYSTIFGSIQIGLTTVMVVLFVNLALLIFLIPPPVVIVNHAGIRATPSLGRQLVIDWSDVRGVRIVRSGIQTGLVFDVRSEFWMRPRIKRWSTLIHRDAVTIAPAAMTLEQALGAVDVHLPANLPRLATDRPRRSPWWPIAAGFFALICGLVFASQPAIGLAFRKPAVERPAAIPGSPCGWISPQTVATLVPDANTPVGDEPPTMSDQVSAKCTIDGPVDRGNTGDLSVSATRYGSSWDRAPLDRARFEFIQLQNQINANTGVNNIPVIVTGIGDNAAGSLEHHSTGDYIVYNANVVIRRNKDIIGVTYTAAPSTPERSMAGAIAVAREILGGLK